MVCSHQSLVTSYLRLLIPSPWSLIPAFKLPYFPTGGEIDISLRIAYNRYVPLGMYRFRQEILGHKQRVGIPPSR